MITEIIFISVNIYPEGEGGLKLISEPVYFIRVTIYPAAFPHYISKGHYLARGWGKEAYCQYFNLFILSGSLFTSGPYPTIVTESLFTLQDLLPLLACIKAIFRIRTLRFCHDIANISKNSYASLKIFHNNKIFSYLF